MQKKLTRLPSYQVFCIPLSCSASKSTGIPIAKCSYSSPGIPIAACPASKWRASKLRGRFLLPQSGRAQGGRTPCPCTYSPKSLARRKVASLWAPGGPLGGPLVILVILGNFQWYLRGKLRIFMKKNCQKNQSRQKNELTFLKKSKNGKMC